MERVQGKVAIVTGGASGIGRAVVSLLAVEGGKVVITDVNEKEGLAAQTGIGQALTVDGGYTLAPLPPKAPEA